jgi:dihydroorotase
MTYDLVIHGGTVIDPASGLHAPRDVAITDSKIAAVEAVIPPERAAQSLDARGKLVLPGLIDLHTHLFWGYHGALPDRACLARGTTTALDGGSTGANAFQGFKSYVVDRSRTHVQAWLNISTVGLIEPRVGELQNLLYVNIDKAVQTAEANRDTIVGFKIRLSSYVVGQDFKPALRLAREAADAARLPIMVHIGDTEEPLSAALPFLRPRDVVTHAFSGRRHGILDYQGNILPAVREARAAGVHFDGAHGRRHFGFAATRRALEQGFQVDTLSSDISWPSSSDTCFHLPQVMSKLMAIGVGLDEVVALVTSHPARYLGKTSEIGTLAPGAAGDVAVLNLLAGDFTLQDTEGQVVQAQQRLQPWRTVIGGEVVEATEEEHG